MHKAISVALLLPALQVSSSNIFLAVIWITSDQVKLNLFGAIGVLADYAMMIGNDS